MSTTRVQDIQPESTEARGDGGVPCRRSSDDGSEPQAEAGRCEPSAIQPNPPRDAVCDEYWCNDHWRHEFLTYPNELDIANNSPEFHAYRKDKISASRIGAVAGLNAWRSPVVTASHYFDPPDPNNRHLIRGITEEPLVRAKLFQVTDRRMPIRRCGIFEIPGTRFSAMPDDIAWCPALDQEVIIEYKRPEFAHRMPYIDYICQTVWQMGVVGLRHAFLVQYAEKKVNPKERNAPQFQIWHIEFDDGLYAYLRACAYVFIEYVLDPCPSKMPKSIPWVGERVFDLFKTGQWVPGHAYEDLPPAPYVERWAPRRFFCNEGAPKRMRITHIEDYLERWKTNSKKDASKKIRPTCIEDYMRVRVSSPSTQ